MIYEFPPATQPIRQGDIFVNLPRVDLSLRKFLVIGEDSQVTEVPWADLASGQKPVSIVAGVSPVKAIVVTQDCDNLHGRDVTLCEIRGFRDVERKSKDVKTAKSWVKIITQHARVNQKWFYLPPDPHMGFQEKMGVDFAVTLRVPRVELEELRGLRKGRLNAVGDEHFRERIAEFFRRYPYDEWYPLESDELKEYRKEYPEAVPFKWQVAHED